MREGETHVEENRGVNKVTNKYICPELQKCQYCLQLLVARNTVHVLELLFQICTFLVLYGFCTKISVVNSSKDRSKKDMRIPAPFIFSK